MRSGDYWEESGQVFVTSGKRYGLTASLRTICMGPVGEDRALQDACQAGVTPAGDTLDTLNKNVTDNCVVCGDAITRKRADSRFCSNRCRQKHYRGGKQLEFAGVNVEK